MFQDKLAISCLCGARAHISPQISSMVLDNEN